MTARPIVFIGIDWADQQHALCLIDPQGRVSTGTLQHDPAAIQEWAASLLERFPEHDIRIALEQSRGALVHALLAYAELQLFPVNPKQLARYREALSPSGSKDDPQDAELLANFLRNHPQQLTAWKPETPETRRLSHLAQFRRKLVDERTSVTLRLRSTLKLYFPLALQLFGRQLTGELALQLLVRWPDLETLKRLHPRTLRQVLARHGTRQPEQQTALIHTIRSAVPLTRDPVLIETHAAYVTTLARQILELNRSIQKFDDQLQTALDQHPDAALFRALPGAGSAMAPRLIVALGSHRERYASACEVQAASGIAPVTRRSGKSCSVSRRYACPTFHKQTFHEFADHARKWSTWSAAFYRMKRAAGMKHHAALRALAFKWIRIIFRLWKHREVYSESKYLQHLQDKHSPLIHFIPATTNP